MNAHHDHNSAAGAGQRCCPSTVARLDVHCLHKRAWCVVTKG